MAMRKVFITTSSFGKIDPAPIKLLEKAGMEFSINPYGRTLTAGEIVELVSNAEGLIAGTEPLDGAALKKLSSLKVISRCGAGLDNVDVKTAAELGIKVYNTPDAPTTSVAELTVGLILSLIRKVCLMDRKIRAGKWQKEIGNLLCGKQVGIIGFGRIGKKVAELLQGFDTKIVYYDPFVKTDESNYIRASSLQEILSTSDIICLHLSYSEENRGLIGKGELQMMKKGAFLINCARGGIVDEQALYNLLKEGSIAGAAIDVFEQEPYNDPLKELDNVILTPHIGSYAREARVDMEIQSVKNLLEGMGYGYEE